MDLIIFGVQGSGKGTQAKLLADKFSLPIYEAGAKLREMAQQHTPLSESVAETMEHGELVRPEITIISLNQFLDSHNSGQRVIFDGLPRNEHQYDLFSALMKKYQRECLGIHILLSKEKAVDRLLKRSQIEHRQDDNLETISNRIEIFYSNTVPVIEKYREQNRLIEVNGDQSVEAVYQEILEKLEQFQPVQA